jgi:hypothetical protein
LLASGTNDLRFVEEEIYVSRIAAKRAYGYMFDSLGAGLGAVTEFIHGPGRNAVCHPNGMSDPGV